MAEEARNDPGSGSTIGRAGTAVKEGIIGSLKGLNEIEAEIVSGQGAMSRLTPGCSRASA